MVRKIEYKNLIQEIETAHTRCPLASLQSIFLFLKMFLFCVLGKASAS